MGGDLEKTRTFENLKRAFFEEAGLAFRYHFFATIAQFEGMERYESLFRELSEGGRMNSEGMLDFLRLARDPSSDIPIGSTIKNTESVLQTETSQFTEVYPEMARVAREEGLTDIASWFDTLEKLKRAHVQKLNELQLNGSSNAR